MNESPSQGSIRVGRIGYLNVLPLYHPLETGLIANELDFRYGPPAQLNDVMDQGGLDVSSCSAIEYARHPGKYLLVPDLAIGSRGPVKSVLLLSRGPVEALDGKTVLVSAQTHTSAALVDLLLTGHIGVHVRYQTGDATALLAAGERPEAVLTIGDEALNLRRHPDYPHSLDLGEAWRAWTGLPFIFGVWIARRDSLARRGPEVRRACELLLQGKRWGQAHLDEISLLASAKSIMSQSELRAYFDGLIYDLGERELAGMRLFFERLAEAGVISQAPALEFLALERV